MQESKPLLISHFANAWQLYRIADEQVVHPKQQSLSDLATRCADIAQASGPHISEAVRQTFQRIANHEEQPLQQPTVVTNPRGRPRGALGQRRRCEPASSTRRDPSHFEYEAAVATTSSSKRCGKCGRHGHNRRTCPSEYLNEDLGS